MEPNNKKTAIILPFTTHARASGRRGAANDPDGKLEWIVNWDKHSQACRRSWTPERKARAAARSRAAWARRKAANSAKA